MLLVATLTRVNPVNTFSSESFQILIILVIPSVTRSSKYYLSCFPIDTVYIFLFSPTCATYCVYAILHWNSICLGVLIMKTLIVRVIPVSCHFVPLRPKYVPQHHIQTIGLCCSVTGGESERPSFIPI
jgi:hypothetical protein